MSQVGPGVYDDGDEGPRTTVTMRRPARCGRGDDLQDFALQQRER